MSTAAPFGRLASCPARTHRCAKPDNRRLARPITSRRPSTSLSASQPALQGFNQPTPILSISRHFACGDVSAIRAGLDGRHHVTAGAHARPRRRRSLAPTSRSLLGHARASRTREVGAQRRALYDAEVERENGPRDGRPRGPGIEPFQATLWPGSSRRSLAPRAPTMDTDAQGVNDPTTRTSGDRREQATGSFTPCSPVLWSSVPSLKGRRRAPSSQAASRASARFPGAARSPRRCAARVPLAGANTEASNRRFRTGTTCQTGGCPPDGPYCPAAADPLVAPSVAFHLRKVTNIVTLCTWKEQSSTPRNTWLG
jgi:hypothetical protein